jgi:site-specific recombinase XerD
VNKKNNEKFIKYFREFLTVYLPKQRNSSAHTVTACQHTWNMLLNYICNSSNKRLEAISFDDFKRQVVMGFLDEMEKTRGWAASTRNQRLGCIRSFFRFASYLEPTLVIYLEDLNGIPLKKDTDKSHVMEFLTTEAMGAVLRQPGTTTKLGIRDTFFMVLMYDSAARDCEMLSLKFCDIDTDKRTVYLLGKRNKPRLVPINEDTVKHFEKYAKLFHPKADGTMPMFYTVRHCEINRMSDDNVARFMKKYGNEAKAVCVDVPNKITPHMFRRSRAMHLYRSGMPLAILAEWLGHEDPETTLIYAYADTEMKRKAIEKATVNGSPLDTVSSAGFWQGNEDIIRRLCGLA